MVVSWWCDYVLVGGFVVLWTADVAPRPSFLQVKGKRITLDNST